jgi:LPS sulfotransferase NodH
VGDFLRNAVLGRLRWKDREAGVPRFFSRVVDSLPGFRSKDRLERELEQAREQIVHQRKQIRRLQRQPTEGAVIKPENVVWIFGAGRSGSTWLASMMGELEGQCVWFEPQLGELFDPERLSMGVRKGQDFVFASRYKWVWLRSVRNFVLDGAAARFPEGARVLVIKEPHGSAGAPLLVEALPESCVVLLVRDPRDTVASALDAVEKGIWRGDVWRGMYGGDEPDERPDAFVEKAAHSYLRHVGEARRAYEAHTGRKVLVRYEDLRADTLGAMKRLYAELGIAVDEGELIRAVEKHSWENIPEEEKGGGKFYRKASPGSWREDLTEEQAKMVEEITAPLLKEFYSEEQT